MYLQEILLENVGPIKFLDLSLPFNENGTPQPVILVGVNGSGKSVFLSYIADALVEFAKQAFSDIVPGQKSIQPPYFKFSGFSNQQVYAEFSIGLLQFSDDQKNYSYVDKTGKLEANAYQDKRKSRFESVKSWKTDGNHKLVGPPDKGFFEQCFYNNVFCYFPPSRKEFPHWLNPEGVENKLEFKMEQKFQTKLGKPIFVESSALENKSWLLDVFLDSMMDFEIRQNQLIPTSNLNDKLLLQRSRRNIESLLQKVLQEPSAQLNVNYRQISPYRLCVTKNKTILVPSLDHLSSGQSVLFNLFATIIRYADKANIIKSVELSDIRGIVIIDEIDAHLHSNLQYEVLPSLVKLFPKIQFIVTTHSPLFLLGMEEEYKNQNDDFYILEMPNGNKISTERFSEFKTSFDYYKRTKEFENSLEKRIKETTKFLVFTEGETDVIYIKTALELLGENELLKKVDVQWVGAKKNGKDFHSGDTALNHTYNLLEANPDFINYKLLLLYDCETNKPKSLINNKIFVKKIPHNPDNTVVKIGIENLLNPKLLDGSLYSEGKEKFREIFYPSTTKTGTYGEEKKIENFKKMKFCKWVCEECKDPNYFEGFKEVVKIIKEFVESEDDDESNLQGPKS